MKNIVICGASKNLGYFLFKKLDILNNVFLLSRSKIKHKYFVKTDLSNLTQATRAFQRIKKNFSKIDVIIFCVGNSKKNYKDFPSIKDFNKSFSDNFYPLVNLINSYLKNYKNKPTKIIAISSIAGVKNINAPITYSVAKNSLNFYSSIIAKELAAKNINLNIISPGNILMENNNWGKKLRINKKNTLNYIKQNVPSNKFCDPLEILNICKLIIENKNNFLGSNIIVDGGQIL
jgi:3-oxoacyl-[acyl-carrier protein] reductase